MQKSRPSAAAHDDVGREPWSGSAPSPADMIEAALGMLRRQIWLIAALAVVGIAAGVLYVRVAPPMYTASAQLMADARKVQIFQQQGIFGDAPVDAAALENQIQGIKGEQVALVVVKKLGLTEDREFVTPAGTLVGRLLDLVPASLRPRGLLELVPADLRPRLLALVPASLHSLTTTVPASEEERTRRALATVEANLKAERAGASQAINISYRALSAGRAADIANAVAEAYLADQAETRNQMTQVAGGWLQDRVQQLREQSAAAERALADFKTQNNIVTANGKSISEDELNQLNAQLVTARAQASEARARLDRIEAIVQGGNLDVAVSGAVAESLNNPVITKLRSEYLDRVNREADLTDRYGPDHQAAVNLRRQIRALRGSILDELKRIGESYKSDYEIARQRRDSLETSLAQAESQLQMSGGRQSKLHELEVAAQTYRSLYDNLLQRYTQSIEQRSFPIGEARLTRPATPPLEKSGPKAIIVMALASFGGLGLGIGLGILRELMDRVFRTAKQVESTLLTDCISIVPAQGPSRARRVGNNERRAQVAARVIGRNTSPMWNVIDLPFSRFSESIRAVKLGCDLAGAVKSNKVIGVTSSLPNEGKSTVAAALALSTAQAGSRVILVDGDLRNPSLTEALAPEAEFGFLDVVSGRKPLDEVQWTEPQSNLTFLPGVVAPGLSNSSAILSSDRTKELFERLCHSYDFVIVDLSPLAPVIDVRATTQFIDSFVFVIEWGRTRIGVVNHALRQARGVQQNVLGVVLNKASIRQLSRYEGQAKEYYQNKHYGRYGCAS
ncbi:MAG: polysaccharide biosynthesis tyrosine autokinase [Xanthobacteraceae bacterium]|jgi:succinoglycan biosynthesis transport protein ExoP